MDNISDLLSQRNISEPPEIKIIKDFILKKYDEDVSVKIETSKIVIFASNSALANSIRMHIPEIQKVCDSDKRIVIYLN
jgi:cytidylate kinase